MKNRIIRRAAFVLALLLAGGAVEGTTVHAAGRQESPFTEEERAYIEKGETLKVGYVCDRRPVSFQGEDGELAGISRYIFDRIAELSGLQFDYVALPAGDITYDYLQGEGFDLVTSVEYNKENQAARGILMSDPYLSSRKVVVAKEGLVFHPDASFKVALSTGSQTIRKVIVGQFPNFEMVDYPSMEACLDAVSRGEADLLIQNQYVVEYWLYKPIYHDLLTIPLMEMEDQLCFSAVTPLEPDPALTEEQELLISVINKSIAMMSDGEVANYVVAATLENMYEYTLEDFVYQYRYMLLILGFAFILICVLLYMMIRTRFWAYKAQAEAKAKSNFLSAMSHEIRTPLNGLISLQYLMSQNVEDSRKVAGYLQQSSVVAQYLLSQVNNVLDMARLQEGELELERKPVNLELLFAAVEALQRQEMEKKHIDFQVDAQLPYSGILGDGVRIQQILIHLLDNARKYTDKGGRVTVTVRQSKNPQGEILTQVQVEDNGCGMGEAFQKKIFLPFTQERTTVSQGNQGVGLGLAICSLLAERMGGKLSVESRPQEGSRFTFEFTGSPVAVQEEDGRDREDGAGTSDTPRILVVEDNELNGQLLVEMLEGEGFQALHVENGKKAVEAFQASAPGEYGVILMDLLMPEMNGFEAARVIRSLDRPDAQTVRIFASTANTLQEDRNKAFQSGMNDFIEKPINIRELLKKLRKEGSEH